MLEILQLLITIVAALSGGYVLRVQSTQMAKRWLAWNSVPIGLFLTIFASQLELDAFGRSSQIAVAGLCFGLASHVMRHDDRQGTSAANLSI